MDLEIKALGAEFKAQGDKGEFEGYFSIFSNVDDGGDIITPGAFSKTIRESGARVRVLYQHAPDKLIGPAPYLAEDARGLYVKGRLTLDAFWGREAWALMKDGALTEGSIGFWPIENRLDYNSDGTRTIREVKLLEVSPVPWGMNPLTSIQAIKALHRGGQTPDDYLTALTTLAAECKEGRTLSTATMGKLTGCMDALQAAMESLQTLLDAAAPDSGKTAIHPAPLAQRARLAQLALRLQMQQAGLY